MITFDKILPLTAHELDSIREDLFAMGWLLINRDLNGRVRIIVPEAVAANESQRKKLETLYLRLAERIAPHAYPEGQGILYEADRETACFGASAFALEGFDNVWVLDRLATDNNWATISAVADGAQRIVFFSIKGGVGRSTALAASAWGLARSGKRVLVLDLDLESPGLSSSLLATDRRPEYGITDWLVEDLVDQGDDLLNDIYASSNLAVAGQIFVVPAHGRVPGEYVSKLGRVWMPKMHPDGSRETWSQRLQRLLLALEERLSPDVILIDSRAGIDDVAAACVTDIGADTVLLFAIQGNQTWSGYQSLFSYWRQRGVITSIRERLQLVAGLVPDDDRRLEYLSELRADAYDLFVDTYDEANPGEVSAWSYEQDDDTAPHAPLPLSWNRGWFGLSSLQQRMTQVDDRDVRSVYGSLLDFLMRVCGQGSQT